MSIVCFILAAIGIGVLEAAFFIGIYALVEWIIMR